ncbi:hypothetical protein AAMO2058_000052000 [Amorphochlora amoebiformis]
MNRHVISALFALLAFLDWNIVAKLTLIVAAVNFITNSDPIARIASVVMMIIMLIIVKCIKRKLAQIYTYYIRMRRAMEKQESTRTRLA